ncbi:MAG: aromatic ring-hydroxylating oxygenase subunit alpha, partial [Dokdonella sp.]|uniref:aromatic ring-hydroxylating oxygenase subunit alpha n=1 Tax=Dokdonella sp. TaxID=2291710 RepID=UPI003F7DAD60
MATGSTHPEFAAQPLATASALAAHHYVGAAAQALDRRAVFARSWQLAAHAAHLSGIGDHVVTEVAGVPLVIVRSEDGELRALHHVCRHRAGPLALCDGRGAKRLRCHYHGWTYALDGRLQSAPEMEAARHFDIGAVHLPQARIAQWQGLVFVALGEVPPLGALLDGIDERVGARALEGYAFQRRVAYEIGCDWKVYVDNYLEGYHVPHIHPELNRMLDYRSYVTEIALWHSLQWSPL